MAWKIEFTDKEITPWSGMVMMKELLERSGVIEQLRGLPLPPQGSNRGYKPEQLITTFLTSVWCGANRYEHLEVARHDAVLQQILGYQRMAGHKAFQRYFEKFNEADNQRVFSQLFTWFFSQVQLPRYTLDVDSTVLIRHGEQQGARKGYNPAKPGRPSHHPLLAFVDECRMVANFWLRSGDAHTANNIEGFLLDTFARLGDKRVGLFRADSGFYAQGTFTFLEAREVNYIVAVRHYAAIQRKIASIEHWWPVAGGIEISECAYQGAEWEAPRRLVVVRQALKDRPKAPGKQLKLFMEQGIYKNYRYSCYITNLDLPAATVWRLYRGRADAENRIKELKEDFAFASFNQQSFSATEAALNCVMIAYNLMSLFKQAVVKGSPQPQLKTLRYTVFAIGGYITRNGDQRVLKLALAMRRRQWISALWESAQTFDWPFTPPPRAAPANS